MVRKTTKGFNTNMTLYSIFGFVTLFLLFFFDVDISRWGITALMLLSS